MNLHLMLDYETLGHIPPNVATLSLGAVLFNSCEIIDKREWIFSTNDQKNRGRFASEETMDWWLKQGPEAQAVLQASYESKNTELDICEDFLKFVGLELRKKIKVWSAGAGFDVPITELKLRENFLVIPWEFYNIRCYRTLKSMFDCEKGMKREGIKHNALHDAIYQAECVQSFLQQNPTADK